MAYERMTCETYRGPVLADRRCSDICFRAEATAAVRSRAGGGRGTARSVQVIPAPAVDIIGVPMPYPVVVGVPAGVALPRVAQPTRVGVAGRHGGRPHGRGGRRGSGRAWEQWRPAGRTCSRGRGRGRGRRSAGSTPTGSA